MALENITNIKLNLGINAGGRVQRAFTNTCRKRMNKYVPMRPFSRNLRKNVSTQVDSITYKSPYAHAQYIGYTTGPVRNYTTPGTGAYWDKKMVSAEMQSIEREMQRLI